MKSITIEGTVRTNSGKKEAFEVRRQGNIPCSLYGGSDNVNFFAPVAAFKDLVYTPEFYTAQINVDGKQYNCVMQDIQFDPISDDVLHIDFREMHPEKKIVLELPVNLEGTAPGVKEGGRIFLRMKKMKVKLYPKDLVEHITVKVDHLDLGKSVRVSELNIPGIEFLNAPNIPIVSVLIPRVEKEAAPAAATTTAAAATTEAAAGEAPPAAEKGAPKADDKKKEKKK